MAAHGQMKLTATDRERITDSLLKIQSAKATLEEVTDGKIAEAEHIDECLESADESLKQALGYTEANKRKT
jgi:hypothetical protein